MQEIRSVSTEIKRLRKKDALCECDSPECMDGNCADCSDTDCEYPPCEGSMQAAQVAMLKSLALELNKLTA